MPDEVSELVNLEPKSTVLFFGAGSSLESGAPTPQAIVSELSKKFSLPDDLELTEISAIAEHKFGRRKMIDAVQELFGEIKATGSILNLPLYEWRSIYTTNYDEVIEQSYGKLSKPLKVFASNFDFTVGEYPNATKLYKLHGTLGKDIALGHNSRMVITESDYNDTSDYRELLYRALDADLSYSNLVIIGYSLKDPHIVGIVRQALDIRKKLHQAPNVYLILYERDDNRALLHEAKGLKVYYGGLSDFFNVLSSKLPSGTPVSTPAITSFLDSTPALRPTTIDLESELRVRPRNATQMYNGRAASYSDINDGLTFERSLSSKILEELKNEEKNASIILGASGTGKTTLARQVALAAHKEGWLCFEHKDEFALQNNHWRGVARQLKREKKIGILFVDDAHSHLFELNKLVDHLVNDLDSSLKLLLASASNHWQPRTKSVNFYQHASSYTLKKLDDAEIEHLLNLAESNAELTSLIDATFRGFNRYERKRRLKIRCESDTFVCLRNIFSSEKFDDIILKEYKELTEETQHIYRLVCGMESSGVKVHRQLIMRMLNIPSEHISNILEQLREIVSEFTVNDRDGIYGWSGRHPVITGIVTKYKFHSEKEFETLFEDVISNIVPSYEIEIRTIRQLCGFESGVGRITDIKTQNSLYRQMISIAPGERVPRHRLIRNLITQGEFDQAETEIKVFIDDFGADGPVRRYKIRLMLARAEQSGTLMKEDREVILSTAAKKSAQLLESQPNSRDSLRIHFEVGVSFIKLLGNFTIFDEATEKAKLAEANTGDPDISKLLKQYERNALEKSHVLPAP